MFDMLVDLNWDTYLELNNQIDNSNFKKEFFSPIAIAQWVYYDIKCKYRIVDNGIIMYMRYGESFRSEEDATWRASTCFYNDNSNIDLMKSQIKEDLISLNGNDNITFSNVTNQMILDFKLDQFEIVKMNYISNYIYEIEKMKTFGGKKLQKKRNHLNAFIKDNHNIRIEDLRKVNMEDIFIFIDYHMKKYHEDYRQYEIDVYKQYLLFEFIKTDKYFGTVVYIDDKIVALTFCYLRKNICEIVIEKAERDIRGLYQFIITENLKYHNVSVEYMDREDDAGIEELAKSKKSYYPVEMVERYHVKNIKNW
ncbi:MAG: phosphatidylglycerol lysyltransferase domain-containing protein [Mycoplasma sp.]